MIVFMWGRPGGWAVILFTVGAWGAMSGMLIAVPILYQNVLIRERVAENQAEYVRNALLQRERNAHSQRAAQAAYERRQAKRQHTDTGMVGEGNDSLGEDLTEFERAGAVCGLWIDSPRAVESGRDGHNGD